MAQTRKPLKRFLKTRHYCNPKLKLGENESLATTTRYREVVLTMYHRKNSSPAVFTVTRAERFDEIQIVFKHTQSEEALRAQTMRRLVVRSRVHAAD